ncbi:MAG: hypothetical protein ACOYN0_12830 [Phycisphaerales bacterium]
MSHQIEPEHWSFAQEVFAHASELPEAERAEYIRVRCGDNHALAAAIEALVAESAEPLFEEAGGLVAAARVVEQSAGVRIIATNTARIMAEMMVTENWR